MNSWKSTLLSACAPPLRMFIIGTGQRQRAAAVQAREVLVERLARRRGRRARQRHRDAEQRVGAEPALVGRAVGLDHERVDAPLIGLASGQRRRDLAVDVGHRLGHALAEVALLVAVAQLERLALAGRGARRHRGAPGGAALEDDIDFDSRVPPRVQDLAAVHGLNLHSDLARVISDAWCGDAVVRLLAARPRSGRAAGHRAARD